jgi:hypothetical protein
MKLDKYYTKNNVSKYCCNLVNKYIKIDYENDLIIEPSAGNGSFIKWIDKICKNKLYLDICPENDMIIKQDYLKYKYDNIKFNNINKIHVIGNPPFGFRSSMAIKFIKKSCEFCDTFSFILPKSFGKASMKKTVPNNFHLIYSEIIPSHSFEYNGNDYDIPCIFQIWEKRAYNRKIEDKIKPYNYKFIKNPNEADIVIRRVGSYAGKIFKDKNIISQKNVNSHYFIKLYNINDIEKIKNINSNTKNFVSGPLSLSKKIITKYLNKMISK